MFSRKGPGGGQWSTSTSLPQAAESLRPMTNWYYLETGTSSRADVDAGKLYRGACTVP